MLFIVVHQSYELWFKLILHELDARPRRAARAAARRRPLPRLRRVVAIERLLLEHLDVLETMGPEGFLEFRDPLEPASGFQSVQFRRIEWISGLRDTFPKDAEPPPGPTLYEAFRACAGLPEDREARLEALADLYRDHEDDPPRAALHAVAELLVDHDEGVALWRHHHVLMAAREIGTRPGTGGSPGVPVPQDHARPPLLPGAVGRARPALSAPTGRPQASGGRTARAVTCMSESMNYVNKIIDEENADKSAHTRRQMVAGAGAVIGGLGLAGLASGDAFAQGKNSPNTPENITTVAATAEVLATIVNTIGYERVPLDDVTKQNIAAAAIEEKIHYEVLTSDAVGGKAATKKIWVPNEVFASKENFLTTLVVGDQIFINAYLIGVTAFARAGKLTGSRFARYAAEFMGAEAVHRALALQSLGKPGNDRVFMRFGGREEAPGLPTTGSDGVYDIRQAVTQLEAAGFGFGKEGSKAGQFYEYDEVSKRTPDPGFPAVNTRKPV